MPPAPATGVLTESPGLPTAADGSLVGDPAAALGGGSGLPTGVGVGVGMGLLTGAGADWLASPVCEVTAAPGFGDGVAVAELGAVGVGGGVGFVRDGTANGGAAAVTAASVATALTN